MDRTVLGVVAALIGVVVPFQASVAQTTDGNRANGFNYQPTPGEVDTREKAVGVPPPPASADKQLEQIDRNLLSKEGASTNSVPNGTSHP